MLLEFFSTKRRGSGGIELDGGWKFFSLDACPFMSAQEVVGILTSPQLSDRCLIGFLWDHEPKC